MAGVAVGSSRRLQLRASVDRRPRRCRRSPRAPSRTRQVRTASAGPCLRLVAPGHRTCPSTPAHRHGILHGPAGDRGTGCPSRVPMPGRTGSPAYGTGRPASLRHRALVARPSREADIVAEVVGERDGRLDRAFRLAVEQRLPGVSCTDLVDVPRDRFLGMISRGVSIQRVVEVFDQGRVDHHQAVGLANERCG